MENMHTDVRVLRANNEVENYGEVSFSLICIALC